MLGEIIGLWCNGNTTVFGAVFQGSSPCRPTKKPRNLRDFLFDIIYTLVNPEKNSSKEILSYYLQIKIPET